MPVYECMKIWTEMCYSVCWWTQFLFYKWMPLKVMIAYHHLWWLIIFALRQSFACLQHLLVRLSTPFLHIVVLRYILFCCIPYNNGNLLQMFHIYGYMDIQRNICIYNVPSVQPHIYTYISVNMCTHMPIKRFIVYWWWCRCII